MYSWKHKQYELLSMNDTSINDDGQTQADRKRPKWAWTTALLTALLLSLALNALVLSLTFQPWAALPSQSLSPEDRSRYANMDRRKPIPMAQNTPYSGHNIAESRKLWEEINIDDGMVALPDSFVKEKGLPKAQRFPWDEDKGLYFLNGYHNLHCLRSVHIALMEFHFGEPQSRRFEHVLHCMEALRQDIICNADDTPRYTDSSDEPESGVGQVRMCRDWSQLESWARQYNSCFAFVNQTAHGFPQVLRYTYCPEGSPYIERIRETFGKAKLE